MKQPENSIDLEVTAELMLGDTAILVIDGETWWGTIGLPGIDPETGKRYVRIHNLRRAGDGTQPQDSDNR